MNDYETRRKVDEIMDRLGTRCTAECPGPTDQSRLAFYPLKGGMVIVQFWKGGGCDHYIQSPSIRWDAMEAELLKLARPA